MIPSQYGHPGIDAYQSYNQANGSYLPPSITQTMSSYILPTYPLPIDRPNSQSFRIDDILLHGKSAHSPYATNCHPSYSPPNLQTTSSPSLLHHYSSNHGMVMPLYRDNTHYHSQTAASVYGSSLGSPDQLHDCQIEKDLEGPSSSVLSSLPVYFRLKPSLKTASGRKCRKPRTVFSEVQLLILEREFSEHRYLTTPHRTKLADRLGLNQGQVKTWFQNRRMKWKKETTEKERQEGKLTGTRHNYSADEMADED